MQNFETSKELFINMKSPPTWESNKSYFDQEKDVLQFYEKEFEKINKGVRIGGYFIHPWLYYHLNFFKTPIPQPNGEEVIMHPPLDDNTLYCIESYQEAEEKNKGLCLFGTRGFTKSTLLTSLMGWLNTIKMNGETSLVGGSTNDLNQISNLLETGFDNVHPAFRLPRIRTDWKDKVTFGLKNNMNQNLIYSHMSIRNAGGGKKKDSEKGAGLNPVGWIADEIGKWSFLEILESALPSFKTQYGAKLVHVLSGTSGNEILSKDAKKLLSNPEEWDVLLANWDRLDRSVPEEEITWDRSKKTKFSTFVPGQMSYRIEGLKKKESNLSDFLKVNNKALKNIDIKVTDWKNANRKLEEKDEKIKGDDSKNKNKMYFPKETADCFLTTGNNPFPTTIIQRRIQELRDKGKTGKDVEIYKEGTKRLHKFVSKERAQPSHPGGSIDAPVIAFGTVPEHPPEKHVNVSGLDGYKLDVSETSSLGSLYVLKRRNLEPNTPCEKIEASYTSRPDKMRVFNETCEQVIETFNAECLIEGIDLSFKQHLEQKDKQYELLAPAMTFAEHKNLSAEFGLYPSIGNNEHRFYLVVEWSKEEHEIGIDDDGNSIIKYSIDFIEDVDLLQEMLNYQKGGNFDRIDAFSHALVKAKQLDKEMVFPENYQSKRKPTTKKQKPSERRNRYRKRSSRRY